LSVAVIAVVVTLAAPAGPARARTAAAFVDSIGVNTHLTFGGTSYRRFGMVRRRLHQLGVRHIRDGVCGGCAAKLAQLGALYRHDGIRVDAIVGDPTESRRALRATLAAVAELGNAVDAVEGANEWDLFAAHKRGWARQDRRYQARLWRMTRHMRGLRHTPVIGPSLVFSWLHPSSWARLGNVSRHLTYGNSHGYAGGGTPESMIRPELERARLVSGRKPVYMTEAGWHNAVGQTSDSHPAAPPDVAAVYVPRLFLANFRAGIRRTYVYELLDHRRGPEERTDKEDAFGLVRASGRPKPAFRSLRNLIHLLDEPRKRHPRHRPRIRTVRVSAPVTVRHLTLRKRDGRIDVALWRPRSIWDQRAQRRRKVSRATTTVTFDKSPRHVRAYRPVHGSRGRRVHRSGRTVSVRIGAAPVVLELR
jgi:hypothetical protein